MFCTLKCRISCLSATEHRQRKARGLILWICVCARSCVGEWKVHETQSCHIFKYARFDGLRCLWAASKMSEENEKAHDGVDINSGCGCWDAVGCGGSSESEMQTPKGNIMTWSTWPSQYCWCLHSLTHIIAISHYCPSPPSSDIVYTPPLCIARGRYERLQTNIVCDWWSAGVRCIVPKISAEITASFTSCRFCRSINSRHYSQRM